MQLLGIFQQTDTKNDKNDTIPLDVSFDLCHDPNHGFPLDPLPAFEMILTHGSAPRDKLKAE